MAFRDKLKQYKMGGSGLVQSSSEELQNLSNQAERPIAPSSPLESSVIGANPDVAKMSGTPNQKASALRVAIQQEKSLPDVQRTTQPRTTQTAEEQAAAEKGQKVQSLNSLNDRVANITNQMLSTAQSSTTGQMQVDTSKLGPIPQENQQEATDLLNKLGTNQATNQDILRLNQLMGKTTVDQQLTADDFKNNFMSAGQSLGTSLGAATSDQIKVSDLDPVQLGFQDSAELAGILGIPEEELAGLSLKDLQEQSQKLFQDEFNKVNSLEAQANDINLGPAERAEARKQLKDMGATGVRKSENAIDKLADQITNADTVNFAGQDMKVQDILSDEYLSGLAARYADAEEGDPFIQELKQSEPELAKWFDDNKEIIKQATAELDQNVKTFSDLQFENQKLKTFKDLPNLSDDMMKQILPDWGELRAEAYNADELPALKMMNDTALPQAQRANVRNAFDSFNQAAPSLIPQLARLTSPQLEQLGATGGPGSVKWQAVTSYLKDSSNLNSISPDQPDTVAAFILGPGKTFNDLLSTAKSSQSRNRSGLFGSSPINEEFQSILNSGNPEQISTYLKEKFSSPNLANLINQMPFSASKSGQDANSYNQQTNDLFNITEKYFNDNANLDKNAIYDMAQQPDNLEKVYNSQLKEKMTSDARASVQSAYNHNYSTDYSNKLISSKLFPLSSMESLIDKKPGQVKLDDVLRMNGTYEQLRRDWMGTSKSQNPLQYEFLKNKVSEFEGQMKKHLTDAVDEMTKTIALENPKNAEKILNKLYESGAPGTSEIRKQVAKRLGLNDEKLLKKVAETIGKKNITYLQSIQSLDLSGNIINEITRSVDKLSGGKNMQSQLAKDVGNAFNVDINQGGSGGDSSGAISKAMKKVRL